MAKAHLQNVSQRIEELKKQRQLISSEIEQLIVYLDKSLREIKEFEQSNTTVTGDNV